MPEMPALTGMTGLVLRGGILLTLTGLAYGLVLGCRRAIARRAAKAREAEPFVSATCSADDAEAGVEAPVRILAFSSAVCRQCHTLQAPALERVLEARGAAVVVVGVDAPSAVDLTRRYRVLTLPTTVVLDAAGRAHAVNYGFANTTKLLGQVDAVLATYDRALSPDNEGL